jgi:hypothetical protein
MTDRAQFEAMLEALINDDQAQAKEIFHNIVVGKSREIYEELLAEDFSQDSGNPYKKEDQEEMEEDDEMSPMEEESEEDSDDSEEDSDDSEEDSDDSEDDGEEGGEENPFGDEEGGEGDEDLEDRVMDLEDALEDLKAEFEQLLAGEEHEEGEHPGIHGDAMGDMGDADMGHDAEVDELAGLMEYVDKVAAPKHGDNGANTKSLIDNMKNDMGGTVGNIAQNHVEVHGDAGTKAGGTKGGLAAPTTKPQDGGNVNVPGAKKATTLKQVKGGGIDRQAGFDKPNGTMAGASTGYKTDRDGETNPRGILNARK